METKVIEKYLVNENATIGEVAATINQEKTGFALVVNSVGKLVGTVTDGDLRRAYLAARDLNSSISTIMCVRPVTVPVGTSPASVKVVANRHRIHQIPVLDVEGRPIEVADIDTGRAIQTGGFRTAVVMAGGEGQRLRPYTENTPKPMLHINGRSILEHIISDLVTAGVERVFISVNYKAEVITNYFGNGDRFGVVIEYLRETEKLGTAGSLYLLPVLHEEPILVMNGDVMTSMNYTNFYAFHRKHRGVMTVATTEYNVHVPFGTIETVNQFLISVVEKPKVRFQCNAGVYALDLEALQYIPSGKSYDMTTLMQDLVHRNGLPVSVFPVHEYWMDIGRPEDLARASGNVVSGERDLGAQQ